MKEFDLSDKELKSLLQEDGLESPSMGFNKAVLSKIEAFEKSKAKPIKAPKWLVFGLLTLSISPALYYSLTGTWDLNSFLKEVEMPALNFDLTISTTYIWISVLTVGVIGMAMLFDKFLLRAPHNRS